MNISDLWIRIPRIHEVKYVFVYKGYSILVYQDETQEVVDVPLFKLEKFLKENSFFRIHRSYLVNLTMIHELVVNDHYLNVKMFGESLPVARRRKKALLRVLGNRK